MNIDMLSCALEKFKRDPAVAGKPCSPLMELTMRNLLAGGTRGRPSRFPRRAPTCLAPAA